MLDRNGSHLGSALALACLVGAWGACQSEGAGGALDQADVGPVIGAGFSASLRADLSKATGMPMTAPAPAVVANGGAPAPAAGAKNAGAPEPAPATGGAQVASSTPETPANPAAAKNAGAAEPAPANPTGAKNAGAPAPAPAAVALAPAPMTAPAATPTAGVATGALTPELAAVKLTLNEGWTRDSVGPGTFSFFAPGEGGKNIRFVFQYGYEDATAPTQREPYKQWLGNTKGLTINVDRQRGAAWFLEGVDTESNATFRYVITYGGRLLTCGGSLYKTGPAAALRDLRDEIIMQAKRICESMDISPG